MFHSFTGEWVQAVTRKERKPRAAPAAAPAAVEKKKEPKKKVPKIKPEAAVVVAESAKIDEPTPAAVVDAVHEEEVVEVSVDVEQVQEVGADPAEAEVVPEEVEVAAEETEVVAEAEEAAEETEVAAQETAVAEAEEAAEQAEDVEEAPEADEPAEEMKVEPTGAIDADVFVEEDTKEPQVVVAAASAAAAAGAETEGTRQTNRDGYFGIYPVFIFLNS